MGSLIKNHYFIVSFLKFCYAFYRKRFLKLLLGDELIMEEFINIEEAMKEIANNHQQTLYSPSKAEVKIEITPRLEGKKVIFGINLLFNHLDRFKDQNEDDQFMDLLQTCMEHTIDDLRYEVDNWAKLHPNTIDYIDFE